MAKIYAKLIQLRIKTIDNVSNNIEWKLKLKRFYDESN